MSEEKLPSFTFSVNKKQLKNLTNFNRLRIYAVDENNNVAEVNLVPVPNGEPVENTYTLKVVYDITGKENNSL